MTPTSSGYQGPDYGEDKKVKPPEDCVWYIVEKKVADSEEFTDVVYASFECDGEVLGMVRLPNPEYLRWLRERIQE